MVQFCDRKLHRMPSNRHFEMLDSHKNTRIFANLWLPFHQICLDAASRRLNAAGQNAYTTYRSTERMPGRGRPCSAVYASKTTPNEHGDWLSSGKLPPVLKQHQRCWTSFIRERWNKRQMCAFIAQNILLKE